MDLLETYKNVLGLGGLSTTSDSMVQTTITGQNKSAVVKVGTASKRLVLPTDFYLKSANWGGLVAFHIFNENQFNKTETPTMSFLRKSINYRANIISHFVAEKLLHIAASPELQKGMGADLLNIMVFLKDATPQQHEKYIKIIEKLGTTDVDRNFTSLFIKKQGQINVNGVPEKFARVASWSFPLAKLLKEASTSKNGQKPKMDLLGIKLNKKDVEVFTNLFGVIMPGCMDVPEQYQIGSNSRVAPSAESLIHASAKVLKNLNYLLDLLVGPKPQLKNTVKADNEKVYNIFHTDLTWVDKLGPLDKWEAKVRLIPIADGATSSEAAEGEPVAQKQTVSKSGGVSMSSLAQQSTQPMTSYNPFPATAPVVTAPVQQATMQTVAAPVQQTAAPVTQPVAQPVAQAAPVKNKGAVSMKDIAKAQPAMAPQQPQVTYINGVAMVPASTVAAQPQMMMATPQVTTNVVMPTGQPVYAHTMPQANMVMTTNGMMPAVNTGYPNPVTAAPPVYTQPLGQPLPAPVTAQAAATPVLIGYDQYGQPVYGMPQQQQVQTGRLTAGLGSGFGL